ncbi:MAG: GTP-binding protein [Myxococcota bacterium]|jgi:GTP-binding protein
MEFRNIAIIAHVDHGKTTLVDGMLRQCKAFQDHERLVDRVMDSMDLERERGITIAAKNTAVFYEGHKINICDTPGHADFGGEVERVLTMVEGAMLLVDASEGPLPQTRFVLKKAMERGLAILVCINKIDRPDARIDEVLDEIYDLFIDLDATEEQLEFPVLFASAKLGFARMDRDDGNDDLFPLLDAIIEHVPAPPAEIEGEGSQLLITSLDYDSYVGRLGLGRLFGAPLKRGAQGRLFGEEDEKNVKVQLIYTWSGLARSEVEFAEPGDIVAIAGIDGLTVGDTVAVGPDPKPLPRLSVDEPTIGMTITINTSPLAGREGKFVTSRQIRNRLEKEMLHNVSLRLEAESARAETFKLFGRGELQLAILIEQMRREGFELSVSRPEVVFKERGEDILEPFEEITVNVPDEFVGSITQQMASRKGELRDMVSNGKGRTRLMYRAATRALIGFRSQALTETRGTAVMNALFDGWDVKVTGLPRRPRGALVSDRAGKTTAYSLFHLQPRGELFVNVGAEVYEGSIVGLHVRSNDLNVNAVRGKQLTNFRSAGADEKTVITPPRDVTLEWALEFIDDDEWVEVTPSNIRLRKRVLSGSHRSIVRST